MSWLFIRFLSILILTSSLLQLFLVTIGLCIQPLYYLVESSPSTNPLLFICCPYHKVRIPPLSKPGKALGDPRLGEKKTDCFPPVPSSAGSSLVPAGNNQSTSLRFQSEGLLLYFPHSYNLNTTLPEDFTVMWPNSAWPGFPVCGIA